MNISDDCLQIDQFVAGTQTINTLAFVFDGEWRGMASIRIG
jgi:hypothetical protein